MGRCTAFYLVINVSNIDLSYDLFDNLTLLCGKEQFSDIGKVIYLLGFEVSEFLG